MKLGIFQAVRAVLALVLVLAVCTCLVAYLGGYGAIFAVCLVCGLVAPENRNK